MASLCRTCGDKAEITTSLLDTSRHHLQWAIKQLHMELDGVLPTSVCVHCDDIIRQWTLFLSKLEKANSIFSTMTANNQSLLHQLTSDTPNTSVPSKPSTSLCSMRLSHQVSNNMQHDHTDSIKSIINEDYVSENDNSSFATPIEEIFIPDIKIESDLDECEISLENLSKKHDADMQPPIQVDNPANTASSYLVGTERLHHYPEPCQLTSHTSNTSFASNLSVFVRTNTKCSISTNSSSSLSDLNLLVKKYHIKDLTIRLSRLSEQVLDSLQQNGTVDCNVVDNQMSEQRNMRIKLEPVTVDPSVCDDQVSDNLQQNVSSTVDDDDIEVPFEAIYDPVVKWEPDLVKSEPSSDLSAAQSVNYYLAENTAFTIKQDAIGNAKKDSDVRPVLPAVETSPVTCNPSSNKDDNICASVFSCADCNFTTNCKSKITLHVVNQHVKRSRYQCQQCKKYYKHKSHFYRHISRVHPNKYRFKCPICKQGFELKETFNAHIRNHDKLLKCGVCGKIFKSKQALTEHKTRIHSKSSALKCDMCSKIFYNDTKLKKHTRAVHSNSSFKCDTCDKCFNLKDRFRKHQREVHASVRAFSCNQCEKTFVTKYALKLHSVVHSDLRPFKCEICGTCFNRSGVLTRHTRTVHSNVRAFKCHLCGKGFKTKVKVKLHLISHSDVRNYKCEQCGKQFKTKAALKLHVTLRSEIRPFACAQCDKKFKTKPDLVQHLRQVHSDLRPFSCDKCNSCFKLMSILARHIREVHSNVKAFKCVFCGKSYKRKVDLTKHLSKHRKY